VVDVSPASTTSQSTNVTVTGKAVGSAVVTVTFYDANGEMTVADNSFTVNVINSCSPPSYSGDSGYGAGSQTNWPLSPPGQTDGCGMPVDIIISEAAGSEIATQQGRRKSRLVPYFCRWI